MFSFSKRQIGLLVLVIVTVILIIAIWCSALNETSDSMNTFSGITVGVIVTDAEDPWRRELNEEMIQSMDQNHIRYLVIDTDRTQNAQIDAIRMLIVYRVQAIILSPVMENGWDFILNEAQDAEIQIITIDKQFQSEVDVPLIHIGYDYQNASKEMAEMLLAQQEKKVGRSALIELSGTVANSVSHGISAGLRGAIEDDDKLLISYSSNGDFMNARAKEIMIGLLRNGYQIDLVVAHNDGMALGTVEALEEYGLQSGESVQVFTFGGSTAAIEKLEQGKINGIVQCDAKALAVAVVDALLRLRQEGSAFSQETFLPTSIMMNTAAVPS